MTIYRMKTIAKDVRMRTSHNTFAGNVDIKPVTSAIDYFPARTLLEGNLKWVASEDGSEVKKNDVWIYVTRYQPPGGLWTDLVIKGWTAHIHKGVVICDEFAETDEETPPPPPPTPEPTWEDITHVTVTPTDENGNSMPPIRFIRE